MSEPPIAPPLEPPPTPSTSLPLHTPPPPFTSTSLEPLTQGAEALVYKTTFLTPARPVILKYRPPKPYRHPTLDARLTKQRLLAEARSLLRVKRGGVNVPSVLGADWEKGWLVLEFVGEREATVRGVLDRWAKAKAKKQESEEGRGDEGDKAILDLMRRVGREIGKLHALGVCHGDLTTSNIMLRAPPTATSTSTSSTSTSTGTTDDEATTGLEGDVYLIDFGLTSASIADEDKAVDLYVLERAFSATHPKAEPLFQEVLRAYGDTGKAAKGVLRRLEDVRLRGRKRSMLG